MTAAKRPSSEEKVDVHETHTDVENRIPAEIKKPIVCVTMGELLSRLGINTKKYKTEGVGSLKKEDVKSETILEDASVSSKAHVISIFNRLLQQFYFSHSSS